MRKINITDMALIFCAPALCIVGFEIGSGEKMSLGEFFVFAPFNVLFLAAPQLVWFFILQNCNATRSTIYGGLIGASVILLALDIYFLQHPGGGDSMGWIFYYPCAVIALFFGGLIGKLFSGTGAKNG